MYTNTLLSLHFDSCGICETGVPGELADEDTTFGCLLERWRARNDDNIETELPNDTEFQGNFSLPTELHQHVNEEVEDLPESFLAFFR